MYLIWKKDGSDKIMHKKCFILTDVYTFSFIWKKRNYKFKTILPGLYIEIIYE